MCNHIDEELSQGTCRPFDRRERARGVEEVCQVGDVHLQFAESIGSWQRMRPAAARAGYWAALSMQGDLERVQVYR